MNSQFVPTHPVAPPTAPVPLRTGLLFLGASVVTVVLVGWGVAIATVQVAGLEGERSRSDVHLTRVEQLIGGLPPTMATGTRVPRSNQVAEGE